MIFPGIRVALTMDRKRETLAKISDYLARGVRLIWDGDSRQQTVTVYRPHSAPVTFGVEDALDSSDVIRGFTCAVRRLFE